MRLRFIFSQVFKGLRANFALSASVTLVTFVSLLFVGSAVLLQDQIESAKNAWYDRVEVSAFLCAPDQNTAQCAGGEATQEQIDAINTFLHSPEMADYVEEVYFETKEEAYANFREYLKDSAWVDTVDPKQMQASFRVKLIDPQEYDVVRESLEGRPGVDAVIDQREQLEPLFNMLNRFTLIAGSLAGVMIVTALLLIPSTIRLSAMFRRNETEIMRFVGASNGFIQAPFVLEGMLASLIGSLVAVAALWAAVEFFIQDWFSGSWLRIITGHDVLLVAPWLILGALVISGLASFLALRRYTRV
ncbi:MULTISPECIES: permease-like cell division protein FtsX [Trueperella]|uniref:Cell division protein FtsX n=1 Tax=Trueperella abortisuis TaxID=445930 RepID=A0ABT9PH70_9ACTO|nr:MULTISPECIES: permease-like cell division protein FtsX [Trueperella]MDP9832059.1 cell division transport system permease protein [Trueperella abortisuis]